MFDLSCFNKVGDFYGRERHIKMHRVVRRPRERQEDVLACAHVRGRVRVGVLVFGNVVFWHCASVQVVAKGKQGEGVIAGVVADYEVSTLWSLDCKYSRYGSYK